MRLLLIDNFDSFVYNLAQAFGSLGAEPIVVRNDASLTDLVALQADGVVVSPGPGAPAEAGISVTAIEQLGRDTPVLGVCLGHQCIGAAFGASVERASVGPVHGKTSMIEHDGAGVFRGLPDRFEATRYHSLEIVAGTLPEDVEVSAHSEDGVIMGVRHTSLPIEGVQFHPESVLSIEGPRLLANFLGRLGATASA